MTQRDHTHNNPNEKKRGCVFWGLIIGGGMMLLALLISALVAWNTWRGIQAATSEQPAELGPVEQTQRERETLNQKLQRLERAFAANKPATVNFTPNDLNAMLAQARSQSRIPGAARVDIRDGKLVADVSVSLDQVPGLKGRYLNAEVDLDITLRDGKLDIYARDIRPKDGSIPGTLLRGLKDINIGDMLAGTPEGRDLLKQVAAIEIQGGEFTVTTVGE